MDRNCKAKCWKIGLMVVVGILAMGWVVMALWNWLIPVLFAGVRQIDYLQALGLLVLSKILFSGLRGHGCHSRWHGQRWERMTPEEREKLHAGFGDCCGKKSSDDRSAEIEPS